MYFDSCLLCINFNKMVQEITKKRNKRQEKDLNNNKLYHSSDQINNEKAKLNDAIAFYSEIDLRKTKLSNRDARIISLMLDRYGY